MSKGFKVKSKAPETTEVQTKCPYPTVQDAWDWREIPNHPEGGVFTYEKIKARMKGKRIVFCLPGRGCSYVFMQNLISMMFELIKAGLVVHLRCEYSSMVNFARCRCLGANVLRGPNQHPWDGRLGYDYQLWIDSDIIFNPGKFWELCDMAFPQDAIMFEDDEQTKPVLYVEKRNPQTGLLDDNAEISHQSLMVNPEKAKKIVSGWYCTEDGKTAAVAHWLNETDFRKNKGQMKHETVESLTRRKSPFTADYVGFGWVLVQYGVFEEMKYPWFAPKMQSFENGEVQDMCGEDVSFCLDAQDMGLEIICDPKIRVGHEKTRII